MSVDLLSEARRRLDAGEALGDVHALLRSLSASDPDSEVRDAAAFVLDELGAS